MDFPTSSMGFRSPSRLYGVYARAFIKDLCRACKARSPSHATASSTNCLSPRSSSDAYSRAAPFCRTACCSFMGITRLLVLVRGFLGSIKELNSLACLFSWGRQAVFCSFMRFTLGSFCTARFLTQKSSKRFRRVHGVFWPFTVFTYKMFVLVGAAKLNSSASLT